MRRYYKKRTMKRKMRKKKKTKRKTRRKKGGYRYELGQIVHVKYPMDGGRWYKWWRGEVVGFHGNQILVAWGYQTPDGFPARDLIDPNRIPVSPPIRRDIRTGGRKKRKSQKRRRKSKKKKRGGNEPNWFDLCDAKYNDRNYRHLTDLEADLYCRKARGENSFCLDGDCKFIESTRPRDDPSSIYDVDSERLTDEAKDGTADQRLEEEERRRRRRREEEEEEERRRRNASLAVLNRRLANTSVSPDAETN